MTETEEAQAKLDEFIRQTLAIASAMDIRHILIACSDAPDGTYQQPVSGTIAGSSATLLQLHSILGQKIVEASAQKHNQRLEALGVPVEAGESEG